MSAISILSMLFTNAPVKYSNSPASSKFLYSSSLPSKNDCRTDNKACFFFSVIVKTIFRNFLWCPQLHGIRQMENLMSPQLEVLFQLFEFV